MREVLEECPPGVAALDSFALWLSTKPEGSQQLVLARITALLWPFEAIGYGDRHSVSLIHNHLGEPRLLIMGTGTARSLGNLEWVLGQDPQMWPLLAVSGSVPLISKFAALLLGIDYGH